MTNSDYIDRLKEHYALLKSISFPPHFFLQRPPSKEDVSIATVTTRVVSAIARSTRDFQTPIRFLSNLQITLN
jgi:hypothetical protein